MIENNQHQEELMRRKFLKSAAIVGGLITSGCMDISESNEPQKSPSGTISDTQTQTINEDNYKTNTFRPTPSEHPGPLILRGGGGPIDIEIFSDYADYDCSQFWNHTLNRLQDYYIGPSDPKITILLKHFPKPVNKWSMFLPCAMMEVRVQLDILAQKEFHERLFENHYPDYSIRNVKIAANMVGADADEVIKAGKERRRSYAIKWDLETGNDYGLEEPLRVVVDGEPVEENTADAIEEAIEDAL